MSRVFISYGHEDLSKVEPIVKCFAEHKILYWFDKNSIERGAKWEVYIKTALQCCDVFLYFNSKNYSASDYCQKELKFAMNKKGQTVLIPVDLDGITDDTSVDDDSLENQHIIAKDMSIDELCNILIEDKDIIRCKITGIPLEIGDSGTVFTSIIGKLSNSPHYIALEPLVDFLYQLKEDEGNGKYVNCNSFSNFVFHSVNGDGYLFSLLGDNNYTDIKSSSNTNVFVKNVMRVLFGLNEEYEFTENDLADFSFATSYTGENKREIVKIVYTYFNEQIRDAYNSFTDVGKLADRLFKVMQASKFFESFDNLKIDYEVTDDVIKVARMKFSYDTFCESKIFKNCIPGIISEDKKTLTYIELCKGMEEDKGKVFLHTSYGCGTSTLLRGCFEDFGNSLYINLANNHNREGRNMLKQCLCDAYGFDFHKLFSYVHENKLLLLIDNFDLLSDSNKQYVISDIEELDVLFNIIFASSNVNVDGKLSLTQKQDMLSAYKIYSIAKLDKEHFVSYITYKLEQKNFDVKEISKEFDDLKEDDRIFEIFDSFTKINLLLDIIKDENSFSVSDIKRKFDSQIKVYQTLLESSGEYSIPRKISSQFKHNIVDIEDVIIELVIRELNTLKEVAYRSTGIQSEIFISNNAFRFRDLYPILNKITDRYYFLNDDIRSYLSAAYVMDCIKRNPYDLGNLDKLLKPIEREYSVLKYLKEFDILSQIGDYNLKTMLLDAQYKDVVLILFKILQYYESGTIRETFLNNSGIEAIPDKFFMGAENITKITIPTSVCEVGRAAFSNAPILEEIDFLPKTKSDSEKKELLIKPWAIINCPKLKKIGLPENYNSYNHPLASRCDELKELALDKNNPSFTTLHHGAILVSKDKKTLFFATNALKGEVKIPKGITRLENNCLSYLDHVTKYDLPASIVESDTNFSDFCSSLECIKVNGKNTVFTSDANGYMYTKDKKTLFRVPSGIVKKVIIPNGVEIIGGDSISCCKFTKHIYVPASVKKIEDYAFADTYALEKLEFEDLNKVKEFGKYIFLSANKEVKILDNKSKKEYKLEQFDKEVLQKSKQKSGDKVQVKRPLKGQIKRALCFEDFASQGIEVIREGELRADYENMAIVRDITLFDRIEYFEKDFNIMLIGMTEYNDVMKKDPIEAEEYVENLISKNHISAVLFSRDLPILSQFENDKYRKISLFRTPKSSTSATKLLEKIIENIGRIK